jgi:diguanylate cyclase (GGDEF)-like protein/PAS domain S-box-containing protein
MAVETRRLASPRIEPFKLWLAVGSICALVYVTVPSSQVWSFSALNMATAVAVLAGVKLHRPAHQTTWLVLGIGLAVYGWGKTIWFYADPALTSTSTANQVASAFFGVGYVLLCGALLRMLRRRDAGNFKTALLDAAIVVAGTAVLWWVFLVQPVLDDPTLPFLSRALAGLYPTLDAGLLVVFAAFILSPTRRTFSERFVIGGLGAILIADASYYYLALGMDYRVGALGDVGWLMGFTLLGAAALHPSITTSDRVGQDRTNRMSSRRVMMYVTAALVGPVSLGMEAIYGNAVSLPTFALSSVCLFLLVIARVVGLLREVESQMDQVDEHSRSLVAAEEKYRTLVEQIPAVTYLHMANANHSAIYVSPRIKDLLGVPVEEWISDPENWVKHLHPDDRVRVAAEHERKDRDGGAFEIEYRMVRADGRVVWVRDEGMLIRDASGEAAYWQGILVDITERKGLEDQLVHQAFHDPLTSLANRALFMDRVAHALSHRGRAKASPIAVLFIDLDDFKTINDSLGHGCGDELLQKVARRISASLRSCDTAARLGGDEFGILVEDMDEPSLARRVASRILSAIAEPFVVGDRTVNVRASIGIAVSLDLEAQVDELLRNADLAMYMAKRDGSGGFSVYEEKMYAAVVERMQLKADLERSIDRNELAVEFQPIVDLRSYRVVGAEALVRWHHPHRGLVSPGEFIGLAEETDLIDRIGMWVLEEVCRQMNAWAAKGLADITVTVNLSGRQLQSAELVHQIGRRIAEARVDPTRIVFEITESALMEDVDMSKRVLDGLKDLGLSLAVDDFGTGYSSLSYLQSFPVDVLKIDRAFVGDLAQGPDRVALVRAVVKLGQELGLVTVAEGIEHADQSAILQELGCDRGQGFYFSPPQKAEAIGELLADELRATTRGLDPEIPASDRR